MRRNPSCKELMEHSRERDQQVQKILQWEKPWYAGGMDKAQVWVRIKVRVHMKEVARSRTKEDLIDHGKLF